MTKRKAGTSKAADSEDQQPEATVLYPRNTAELFGHGTAEELFVQAYRAGALHHAWLLTGEQGIGKATFAYRAARFLLSQEPGRPTTGTLADCRETPAARQIAAGAHSSLFVLDEAAAASIGVGEVRKLRSFLSLTSPGGWRAMIVDPANSLTIASANALLKAVEEPPPRTVFFLVSHGAAAVMPTIRSRCVKLAFRPLSLTDFSKATLAACHRGGAESPGPDELEMLHGLTGGSPGRALDFISGGLLPVAQKLNRIVDGLPRMDYGLVHELIQAVAGARNAQIFNRICDLIEARIEELAKRDLSRPGFTGAQWAELWQAVRRRRLEMEALNLDKAAFLMSVFSDMENATKKPC